MINEDRKKLYDALSSEYDLGTYEEFERNIGDSVKRRKLYDAASADYDLGDFESYSQRIGPTHKESLDAFTAEHGSWLNDFEARDSAETNMSKAGMSSGIYVPAEGAITGEERKRYMELHKQEEALKKAWFTSDEYLAQKDADALFLSDARKGLSKQMMEYAQANPVLRQEGPFQINPYATRGAEADTELEKYRTASRILDDAIKMHNAPSKYDDKNVFLKFRKGAGDVLSDADFWTAGLTEIADNLGVRDVLSSVQEKLGNLNDLSEEAIENILSPAEKAVLQAWALDTQEQLKRKDDLSRAYQAGQSATESLGFMAEFALTGGIGKAATEGVEQMAKWLGKKALTKVGGMTDDVAAKVLKETGEKIAQSTIGKYGVGLAESLAEAAGRTGVMPSTFRNISEKATEIETDENGNNYLVKMNDAFAKGYVDSFIENLSEGGRVNALGTLFGDVAGKIPAYKKMVDKFSHTKASELWEAFNSSGVMNTLRAGGWHGLGEEYLEEWYGNALRTLTGVDKEALKDFATVDNQIVTLTSFLPMTIFGGTVSTAQVLSANKDLEKKAAALKSALMERGYDEAQANNMIDMMRGAAPAEVSETLTPIVNSVANRNTNEAAALMKPVGEFAAAVQRWQSFNTKYNYQEQEQRDGLRAQMEENLGQFWQQDENGRQTVQRGVNEKGEVVYMLGKPSVEDVEAGVTTEVAAVTSDGRKVFVNPSEYQLEDELEMNTFLGNEIMAEKGNQEQARMIEEKEAKIAAIREAAVPGTAVNIGTAEAPMQAIVLQRNPDGVIVNTPDGQTRQMTYEEFGNYVGVNAVPMTDAQIDEHEADVLTADRVQREAALDQEYDNDDAALDELAEAEDEIEQAVDTNTPLPMKADGSVDQTALWNKDPEGWAKWNDEKRQDGGADSQAYVTNAIAIEQAKMAELQAVRSQETDFDRRDALDAEIATAQERINRLVAIQQGYLAQPAVADAVQNVQPEPEPQTEEERAAAEEQRREPFRKRAKELGEKLGVKINIAESLADVQEEQAREEIIGAEVSESGARFPGWYNRDTGEVTIYLPHVRGVADIDRTIIHEVVAHKGLRGLLGKEGYNVLCDAVWDMMTEAERAKYMAYPGVNGDKRLAADEYIARFAEGLDLEQSRPIWNKIAEAVQKILNSMGIRLEVTKEDLADLIAASYMRLQEQARAAQTENAPVVEEVAEEVVPETTIEQQMPESIEKPADPNGVSQEQLEEINKATGGEIETGKGKGSSLSFSVVALGEGAGIEILKDDGQGNVAFVHPDGRIFNANNPIKPEDLKTLPNTVLGYMMKDAKSLGVVDPAKERMLWNKYTLMLNAILSKGSAENGGYEYLSSQWQWIGDTIYKTVAINSDSQYSFSLDITRVCKKNEAVINAIAEMQARLGYGITPGQIMDIYLTTSEEGYQVPCPVCYVFSRYIRNGKYATIMINGQRKYGSKLVDPKTLTPAQQKKMVQYWLNELDKIKAENKANSKEIAKANSDITTLLDEIDKLSKQLTDPSLNLTEEQKSEMIAKIYELDARYKAALNVVSQASLDSWITQFAIHKAKVNGKEQWVLFEDSYMGFPEEMALDLRQTATVMRKYPAIQRFRNSRGAAAGKEITFVANNDLGDVPLALGSAGSTKDLAKPREMSEEEWKAIKDQEFAELKLGVKNLYQQAVQEKDPAKKKKILEAAKRRFTAASIYAKQQSLRGGQRMWSWSDNIERLAPDVFVNLLQLEMLGGALQSYSKQLEGIKLVASMNGYVNGSLMGKGNGYREVSREDAEEVDGQLFLKDGDFIVAEPGKKPFVLKTPVYQHTDGKLYVLEFDDVVGIDPFGKEVDGKHMKGLFELNAEYDRAGNIIVGMNDLHIRMCMADDRIFFIIPWHSSGANTHILAQMYEYLGVEYDAALSQDYTNVQSEKRYKAPTETEEETDETDIEETTEEEEGKKPESNKISQFLVDFWNDHYENAREFPGYGKVAGKDFACGIEGGVEPSDGNGNLSASQMHYRELRDAIFVGVKVPNGVDKNGKAKTKNIPVEEYSEEWLNEIMNDEFLSQVYSKVRAMMGNKGMTNADTKAIYPYEYWDENSTYDTADINGARYLEYCRRLGYKPKFCGKLDGKPETDFGNFTDDKGYWKVLIDRRMYGLSGRFQDLTPVTAENFTPDLVDPEVTKEEFVVTRVADEAGTQAIVDKAIAREESRPGGIARVDYDMTLSDALDVYAGRKPAPKKSGVIDLVEEAKKAVEKTSNISFSFIGERGAANDKTLEGVARLDNLETARQMESQFNPDWSAKENEAALKIKIATGWERGADGKWRYEVEDVKAKPAREWLTSKKKLTLKDIVEPNPIFDLYPDLLDINIVKDRSKYNLGAYYSEAENSIKLPVGALKEDYTAMMDYYGEEKTDGNFARYWKVMESDILHELQHAIQHREGFALGGSPDGMFPEDQKRYNELYDEMSLLIDEYNKIPYYDRLMAYAVDARKEAERAKIRVSNFHKAHQIGEYVYKRLAGEVEARNASKRRDMSPEERRNTLLAATEDVARKDQIFLMDAVAGDAQNNISFRMTTEMKEIKEKAQADGTFMKAPNGQPTNLTEEQWLMVRTQNFIKWFGNWENDPENASKVVDENGEPKVVYHQTNQKIYVNRETGENWDELGWKEKMEWDNRDDWEDYWEEQDFNTFSRVNARTTNEFDGFFFAPEYDEYHEYGDRTIAAFVNIKNPASREDYNIDSRYNDAGRNERIRLQEAGFDGVIRMDGDNVDEYIAFEPNQIKSATDNNGDFNPKNNNISFRVSNDNQAIFVSNAAKAVEGIKQEKATPEQWLKMIEKNGGLKAGEDKWMGLSDWLKASDRKTLTKAEVLEFVNEHMIVIEEQHYGEFSEEERERALFENLINEKGEEFTDSFIGKAFIYEEGPRGPYLVMEDAREAARLYRLDTGKEMAMEHGGPWLTKDEFTLKEWANAIIAKASEIEGVREIDSIRKRYSTEGLENKHEIALTIPTIEPWKKRKDNIVHFEDAGEGRAVAWIRFGETTTEDGNSVLVIDEIQSARHQEGREKGYATITQEQYTAQMNEKYGTQYFGWQDKATPEEWETYRSLATAIPDAPFEKNWAELGMKRMLRYAAENGYDHIAWTKGDQQAERYKEDYKEVTVSQWKTYDTTKKRSVHILFNDGGTLDLGVNDKGVVTRGDFVGENLSEVLGKEFARKILSIEGEAKLSGEGLDFGEGMRGFYDKMLPAFMNKYGKKWGVKVEDIDLPNLENGLTMHSVPVTEEMKASVMGGQVMFRMRTEEEDAMEFQESVLEEFKQEYRLPAPTTVVDVYDRDAVANALGYAPEKFTDAQYDFIMKGYQKGGVSIFDPETKRIAIFAKETLNESWKMYDCIFHENTHFLVAEHPDLLELGEWLWQNSEPLMRKTIKEHILANDTYKGYETDEMLSGYTGVIMATGKADVAYAKTPEELRKHWDLIFNAFGYGRKTEDNPRRRGTGNNTGRVESSGNRADASAEQKHNDAAKQELTAEERRVIGEYFPEFNKSEDVRMKVNSQGKDLTEGQKEFFANSKAVDKDGNLLVLYHGTPRAGFTEFKSGWFTTSKEDAISYSGDRKGRLFNPSEKYEPETLTAGDFRLGYMTFDSEEDRAAFLGRFPYANEVMSEREYEDARIGAEDEEYDALTARSKEFAEVWNAYREYERERFVDTPIADLIANPEAYTEEDLMRAMLEYDSNATFDSLDDMSAEERKDALVSALQNANEETEGGILDMVIPTRVPRNGEGIKHNDLGNRTYEVYANVENPYEIDANGRGSEFESGDIYKAVEEALADNQYDGVIIRNWRVGRYQQLGDVVVPKDGNQIKLTSNENPTKSHNVSFRTSLELDEEFGDAWRNQQNEDGRHSTQVANTKSTYEKIGRYLEDAGMKGASILDASSGLGLGTQALREMGFKVDDVEPFPSENREAPTFSSYADIDKQYDVVISNAVLNVIPDDWRADVLHQMADAVKEGGKMIINTRPASNIAQQGVEGKTRITLDSPSEILVKRGDRIAAYQKGFTSEELAEWIKSELGEGWRVEKATKKNSGISGEGTAVVIKEGDNVSFRVTGTPTDEVVANGLSLTPAQTAEVAANIFAALPEESRKKITDGLNGNILGLKDAILQIPASLATKENWNEEDRAMADVVAEEMTKMAGEMTRPFSAPEALWLLYNNLNKGNDLISQASRALVQRNLGFDEETLERQEEAKRGVSFRMVGDATANAKASMYNRGAVNVWTRLKESFVDMQASVEELVSAIEKATGKEAKGFENILLALNQQSSKGLAAMESYEQRFLMPMFDEIRKIMDKAYAGYDIVVRYVILKHGLERNKKLAQRDAKAHYQEIYDEMIAKVNSMDDSQKRTYLTNAQLQDADAKAKLATLKAADTSAFTEEEKNAHKRELAKAKEEAKKAKENLERAQKINSMSEQELKDELDKIFEKIENGTDSVYKELRKNDYSGISSMFYDQLGVNRKDYSTEEEYQAALMLAKNDRFSSLEEVEAQAEGEVSSFEGRVDTKELWKRINAATKETLRQQYEANIISKDQYENLRNMFEYYVPLRGFKDNTAEDMYTYYRKPNSTGYTKPILGAEGRKTEAESPFGWIAAMAGSAIASNVKNEAKLALYYFVSNRPNNGIATLSRTWFVHTPGDMDANGKKIFKPAYPPFSEDLSSDAAKQAYEDWQEQMRELQKQGLAYEAGQRLNLGNAVVNISDANKPEHVVTVKVAGKDYTIVINGNPRAAQAINGELNIESTADDYSAIFGPVLRWMSSVNTSYNPEFWITNLMRDMAFTWMAVNTKEDPAYRKKFSKNYWKCFRVIGLVAKNEKGTIGNSYIEDMYKDFVKYGGVTGYTQIKDSETWEKEIDNYLSSTSPESLKNGKMMRGMKTFFHAAHRFGESLEQVSRFAAFLTSREMGKTINEAIADAKEITVNFNRKGSGKMITLEESKYLTDKNGQPLSLPARWAAVGLSSIAPLGRRTIMFFNAAVQGLNSVYRLWKKNPKRLAGWTAAYFTIGVLNAAIHALLDDDDDYLDIPQYERRNSLMLGGNGAYLKWALPQEARAFYALGDLAVETILGRNPHQNVVGEAMKIATEVLPVNPTEGWKAFVPSVAIPAVELMLNEDYKGAPIYNEQKWLSKEERERTAKWSSAYQGTGAMYKGIAQGLNYITGGDKHDAGKINLQPEKMEHIVQSAFGGTIRTADKFINTIWAMFDPEEDVTVRQTPFLNRILTLNDERFKNVHVNEVFDYYKADADHALTLEKKYRKDRDQESLNELRRSDEYQWAKVYRKYKKALDNLKEKLKVAEGTAERKELMRQQDELKRRVIKEISEL